MSELSRNITIINRLGLHARAAAKLVTLAAGFRSEIKMRGGGREVDAKSIMAVMMLAAAKDTTVEFKASGEDAADALDSIEELIRDRFGEPE